MLDGIILTSKDSPISQGWQVGSVGPLVISLFSPGKNVDSAFISIYLSIYLSADLFSKADW